jgi:hypothetical protein
MPRVARISADEKRELLPLFIGDEKVSGVVKVDVQGRPLVMLGIKVELVGQIGKFDDDHDHN